MSGSLIAMLGAVGQSAGPTSITVGIWSETVEKVGTYYWAGYDNGTVESDGAHGSLSPSATYNGETIVGFVWANFNGGYGASGNLELVISGNQSTTSFSATVNGVSLGSSGAGSYSSPNTTYTWSGISNPFGSTAGAVLSMRISEP